MDQTLTLRQHRMSQGLTIRALAEKAGISTQTIVAIEKGKPARMQSFRKIADALGVEMMGVREYHNMVMTDPR